MGDKQLCPNAVRTISRNVGRANDMRCFKPNLMVICLGVLLASTSKACRADTSSPMHLSVGSAYRLPVTKHIARLESTNSNTVEAFNNGYLIGLQAGEARIRTIQSDGSTSECQVSVREPDEPMVDPATLKQFPDDRRFVIDGRVCYGSELNGQRAADPMEREHTRSNRIINPHPLTAGADLEWEVREGAEVRDGAGVMMGTVASALQVGNRLVPTSKFNFGMSKVIDGRMYVYAFSVAIQPTPWLSKLLDPRDVSGGHVRTSAWLPLDQIVDKETLLERVGIGKVKLPRLPLEEERYRITGGDAGQYMTAFGEMSIVKRIEIGAKPSHYLRRPSGTVNLVYSVPGFGLGGQGLDAFLVSDGAIFRPARGAKVFIQPTYFPKRHPEAGEVSPHTMTFIYGAVEVKGSEPVYGWIAREALSAEK